MRQHLDRVHDLKASQGLGLAMISAAKSMLCKLLHDPTNLPVCPTFFYGFEYFMPKLFENFCDACMFGFIFNVIGFVSFYFIFYLFL